MNRHVRIIGHLLRNDIRLVARDRMLATMTAVVLISGIAMRFALPAMDTALADAGVMPSATVTIRFADTFPAFVGFLALWQGANISGIIFGFVLLGEKEDHTLAAMQVTPLSLHGFARYRIGVATAFAFLVILYLSIAIGLCRVPFAMVVPLAAAGALTAPLSVLTYATFAANKIQGLAYTKFGGLAGLIMLVGYFVPEPGQWAFGLFPPFLVVKAYWMALAGRVDAWWPLVGSIALQLALIRLLLRRFTQVLT